MADAKFNFEHCFAFFFFFFFLLKHRFIVRSSFLLNIRLKWNTFK